MKTLADITGDNAVHQIFLPEPARWVQVAVTGSGTVRLGDSTVSSTRGLPLVAGAGQMLPSRGGLLRYQQEALYVYVPSGATVSVAYGV